MPGHVDSEPMADEEAAEFIIDSSLGSLGVGCYDDIRTYHNKLPSQKIWNGRKEQIESFLDQRVKDGHLVEIAVADLSDRYFAIAKTVDNLQTANFFDSDNAPVRFLTPFDNILRERSFPKRIWNFDYKIECYVPAPDRVYGYFVLPILDRTDLSGRMDAKVHRKKGILEIKAIYLESEMLQSKEGLERLKKGVLDFAEFHSCDKIEIRKVKPQILTKLVRALTSEN